MPMLPNRHQHYQPQAAPLAPALVVVHHTSNNMSGRPRQALDRGSGGWGYHAHSLAGMNRAPRQLNARDSSPGHAPAPRKRRLHLGVDDPRPAASSGARHQVEDAGGQRKRRDRRDSSEFGDRVTALGAQRLDPDRVRDDRVRDAGERDRGLSGRGEQSGNKDSSSRERKVRRDRDSGRGRGSAGQDDRQRLDDELLRHREETRSRRDDRDRNRALGDRSPSHRSGNADRGERDRDRDRDRGRNQDHGRDRGRDRARDRHRDRDQGRRAGSERR
eukprot:INCI14022.2.p1 GENE.INCI14022.2~~INCI14022.2.p1  ORF type:complete len:274 (-),score=25.50 INCI14022.2:281-1102(-)